MSNWTAACNYRYEQHFEFYTDGRYRVKTGAYGRGCGNNQLSEATYRPVVRMDLAVFDDAGNTFSTWDGSQWVIRNTEGWWLQSGPYTAEGYLYRIMDENSGFGYYMEPGQGQFGDFGTGDNAYTYLTLHRASEGDADTGSAGHLLQHRPPAGAAHLRQRRKRAQQEPRAVVRARQRNHHHLDGQQRLRRAAVLLDRQTHRLTWPCFSGPMFTPNTAEVCSPLDFDCTLTIDSSDIAAVASHWGCVEGEPSACYEARFDLDSDGDIDIIDVLMERQPLGLQSGRRVLSAINPDDS